MRTSLNLTELLVWSRLRRRGIDGWKFRRQQPIGPYFADFYCPAARLIVEIDGPAHDGDASWAYDERRQAFLEMLGYRVMRINVGDISRNFESVLDGIRAELLERERLGYRKKPLRRFAPPPHWRGEELCPTCPSGASRHLPTGVGRSYFGSSLMLALLMQ